MTGDELRALDRLPSRIGPGPILVPRSLRCARERACD